jgi:hypothetical protein
MPIEEVGLRIVMAKAPSRAGGLAAALVTVAMVVSLSVTRAEAQPLTLEEKSYLSLQESTILQEMIGGDVFYQEVHVYPTAPGGQTQVWYQVHQNWATHQDPENERVRQQTAAVIEAVRAMSEAGVKIPYGLRVYCTNGNRGENHAFSRITDGPRIFVPVADVVLSSAGSWPWNSLSASPGMGLSPAAIAVIHEVGHILHERQAGDAYWRMDSARPLDGAQLRVSGWATATQTEFVAEVFTGLVLGRNWPEEVMAEYASYRGPKVP